MVPPNEPMCHNKEAQHVDIPKPPRCKDSKFRSIEYKKKGGKKNNKNSSNKNLSSSPLPPAGAATRTLRFPVGFRSEQPEGGGADSRRRTHRICVSVCARSGGSGAAAPGASLGGQRLCPGRDRAFTGRSGGMRRWQPPTGLPAAARALREGIRPLLGAATLFLRAEAVLPLAREMRAGAADGWESLTGETGTELRRGQGAVPAGQPGRCGRAPEVTDRRRRPVRVAAPRGGAAAARGARPGPPVSAFTGLPHE